MASNRSPVKDNLADIWGGLRSQNALAADENTPASMPSGDSPNEAFTAQEGAALSPEPTSNEVLMASLMGAQQPSLSASQSKQLQDKINEQLGKQQEDVNLAKEQYGNQLSAASNLSAGDRVDLTPAMSYLDSLQGTQIAKNYTPPTNPNDQSPKLLDALTKSQKDLSGENITYLKDLLMGQAKGAQNKLASHVQDGRDFRNLVSNVQHNKNLQSSMSAYGKIQGAMAMLDGHLPITPQLIEEAQHALAAGMNAAGGTSVEREATYVHTLDQKLAEAKQKLLSSPVDLGQDHPIIQNIRQFAAAEQNNINNRAGKFFDAAASGFKTLVDRNPDYAINVKDMKEKMMGIVPAVNTPDSSDNLVMKASNPGSKAAKIMYGNTAQAAPKTHIHGSVEEWIKAGRPAR